VIKYLIGATLATAGAVTLIFKLDSIPAGMARNLGAVGILALVLLGRMLAARATRSRRG
jgi:hypothetical protein